MGHCRDDLAAEFLAGVADGTPICWLRNAYAAHARCVIFWRATWRSAYRWRDWALSAVAGDPEDLAVILLPGSAGSGG